MIREKLSALAERLENYPATPGSYMIMFFSVSFFRNFLEGLAESSRSVGTNQMFETAFFQMAVLFNLEWFALLCALCAVISFFASVPVIKVMKVFLASYIVISVVPVINFIAYFPSGCKIDYLYTVSGYLNALAFFFVPFANAGVCTGIRIEVFAGFSACFCYVFIKSKSAARAFAAALSLYFLAVSSMAFPVFITLPASVFSPSGPDLFVSSFFNAHSYSGPLLNRVAVMIFLFLIFLLFIIYALWRGRTAAAALAATLAKPAPLIFCAAYISGFISAPLRPDLSLFGSASDFALLAAGIAVCAICGVYYYSSVSRGTSGNDTPLLPLLAATGAASVSYPFLFTVLFVFSASAFMSNKPFEFSRFRFFPPAFFALCTASFFLAGFISPGQRASLAGFNPVFAASAGLTAFILCMLFDKTRSALLSAALTVAFTLSAFFQPHPAVLLAAPVLSVISAALSYYAAPSKKRNTALALIFSAFLITAGLTVFLPGPGQ